MRLASAQCSCSFAPLENFSAFAVQRGDDMIKNADRLMAEAIRELAGIYKDGILPKPANY